MKHIFKKSILLLLISACCFTACDDQSVEEPEEIANPQVITINQLKENINEDGISNYLGQWVQIENVQFLEEGVPFNSTGSNSGGGKNIVDTNFNTALVHTSPDRDFAYLTMPTGSGTIKAYVSQYEDKIQLLLKNVKDATAGMTNPRFVVGEEATIKQIKANVDSYKDKIFRIKNVQFANAEVGKKFNGTDDNRHGSKVLEDCNKETIIVFTYKTDSHSNDIIPAGNQAGLTAKVGKYGDEAQLYLVGSVPAFTGARCP